MTESTVLNLWSQARFVYNPLFFPDWSSSLSVWLEEERTVGSVLWTVSKNSYRALWGVSSQRSNIFFTILFCLCWGREGSAYHSLKCTLRGWQAFSSAAFHESTSSLSTIMNSQRQERWAFFIWKAKEARRWRSSSLDNMMYSALGQKCHVSTATQWWSSCCVVQAQG